MKVEVRISGEMNNNKWRKGGKRRGHRLCENSVCDTIA